LLLVTGLVVLVRRADTVARLIVCTFLLSFAGGVFSISQEGAPYIYRTAAVIVPAFLIAGLGLQWVAEKSGTLWLAAWCVLTAGLNLYLYFGLEAKNIAAMRVMAYEPRLIGLEIARDNVPVWVVDPDVLIQTEVRPRPGEKYGNANPAVLLSPILRRLAIINFSGRYDAHKPVSENLAQPNDIYFVEPTALATGSLQLPKPARIIFNSRNQEMTQTVTRLDASIKYLPNILGEPLLMVAEFQADTKH
jgi:hypothetical protein